ncbi:adenylate/guanylate cyclase domain-containing protein [Bradyrhizobium brasilense]|uniref:adenylate/guanylate cyclase domain-containing protein n=1 Tax=Bradyrhizobium brasilense TaxID=1419277 RepID=UPI001E45BB6C|nr:adenylate/guanylate cyclase domain-containing protein [Bradyrhizobium brasilense]MCC8975350.1 adenylate/guanylate cyclase domain-containing protein [Bradyrhizobium brasilense]
MSDLGNVSRKLVAVFAADVEGYSRLMGADEVGTLKGLTERRAILDKLIADHKGRIANTAGDSVLAEFGSAVDAVKCAVEAQSALAEANADVPSDKQINFRIGVHIGDVMVRAGDLFGDGVNIAARLQTLAAPGAVCLSGVTYDQVRKVLPLTFVDLGAQQVKNIQEPIRAYRVGARSETRQPAPARVADAESPPPLPDKPSIAVLPFQNMSGDAEQEYFADGVVEDIITALSRFKSLFVIARNSSFTFKGRTVDIKEVGRALGVRYVLEGSVRKAGGRVRITGQLLEASTGVHIWAERFDRELNDIFTVQDEITENVAAVIEPRIKRAEIEAAARRRPNDLNAYDLLLRAQRHYYGLTKEDFERALQLCYQAIEIDPSYAGAARLAAEALVFRAAQGWSSDVKSDYAEAMRLGRLALTLDDTDPEMIAQWGRGVAVFSNDYDTAKELVDRAVMLNSNSARAWTHRGWTYRYLKQVDEALNSFERAMRLNPLDPLLYDTLTGIASALIVAEQDAEAAAQARKALALNPRYTSSYRCLAAALAHLGDDAGARAAASQLMATEPSFRISTWANYGGQWQGDRFLEGLRKAGLPE